MIIQTEKQNILYILQGISLLWSTIIEFNISNLRIPYKIEDFLEVELKPYFSNTQEQTQIIIESFDNDIELLRYAGLKDKDIENICNNINVKTLHELFEILKSYPYMWNDKYFNSEKILNTTSNSRKELSNLFGEEVRNYLEKLLWENLYSQNFSEIIDGYEL